jgi:hypothetical protein
MDSLSVTCIAVGILIIAMRAPLIFAPRAALRFYDRVLFSTNARCRAFSVVIAIVAVTLLLLAFHNGPLAGFLYVAGWIMAGGAVFILVRPSIFRGFWRSMFSFVERSVPAPFVLVRGVLGVLAGVALIYVGVYVV